MSGSGDNYDFKKALADLKKLGERGRGVSRAEIRQLEEKRAVEDLRRLTEAQQIERALRISLEEHKERGLKEARRKQQKENSLASENKRMMDKAAGIERKRTDKDAELRGIVEKRLRREKEGEKMRDAAKFQMNEKVGPPVQRRMPLYTRNIDNQQSLMCGFHSVMNVAMSDTSRAGIMSLVGGENKINQVNAARQIFDHRVTIGQGQDYMHPRYGSDKFTEHYDFSKRLGQGYQEWWTEKENLLRLPRRHSPHNLSELYYLNNMDNIMVEKLMRYYGYDLMGTYYFGNINTGTIEAVLNDPRFVGIIHGGIGHWQAIVKQKLEDTGETFFYDIDSFVPYDMPVGDDGRRDRRRKAIGNAKEMAQYIAKGTSSAGYLPLSRGRSLKRAFLAFGTTRDPALAWKLNDGRISGVDENAMMIVVGELYAVLGDHH